VNELLRFVSEAAKGRAISWPKLRFCASGSGDIIGKVFEALMRLSLVLLDNARWRKDVLYENIVID
jgi:hypothetical protein